MKQNRRIGIVIGLICPLFIGGIADAQSINALRQAVDNALDAVVDEKDRHGISNNHLNEMITKLFASPFCVSFIVKPTIKFTLSNVARFGNLASK